jgi:hypothetical protein
VQGENIALGSVFPPTNYRAEVADLLDYYSKRFVGREAVFGRIDNILAQRETNYLLVEAPAGYGKSALVTQLVLRNESGRLSKSFQPSLVFFFVRDEGARNTSEVFLPTVNSQLLHILKSSDGVPVAFQAQRAQFTRLWEDAATAASAERPLLLLIDGFDELAAEKVTIADLLPSFMTPYVHVAVFSRPNPSPREKVPLEHPFRRAEVIRLDPLGLRDIRDLLQSEGPDTDRADALALRVLDATRGVPLFARFVCEDISRVGEQALLDLEEHPPEEVEEYFHRQFEQLDSLTEGEEIIDVLGLMLVSHGAMSIEEMAETLSHSPRQVRRAIESVQRFLLGSDRFQLMHLQLRKAIAEDFSEAQCEEYRGKLLTWCRSFADAGWPTTTPDYVLEHFATHLREAQDRPALYALVKKRWMQLKAVRTGSHRSFAADMLLAADTAACEDPPNLAEEFRCSLAYATLGSLVARLPVNTLGIYARLGQLTKAMDYSSLIPDIAQRSAAYCSISHALAQESASEQAISVAMLAVAAAERIEDLPEQVPAMIGVAEVLGQAGDRAQAEAMLERAFTLAEGLRPGYQDFIVGNRLTGHADAVREIAKAAAKVGPSAPLVEALEGALDRAVVALEAVKERQSFDDQNGRAEVVSVVVALVRLGRVEQALSAVRRVSTKHKNAVMGYAIERLARDGEADRAAELTEQALAAGQILEEEGIYLEDAAQDLAEVGKANWALAVAQRITGHDYKGQALAAVALAFAQAGEAEQARRAAEQAVQAVKATDRWSRPRVLAQVAEMLAQAHESRLAARAATDTLDQVQRAQDDEWPKSRDMLGSVALAFAWAGETEQARQVAEQASQQPKDPSDRWYEDRRLAQAFALIGDVDQAWALAQDDHDVRYNVAQALLRSGRPELLLSLPDRAPDPEFRDEVLNDVATLLLKAGELDQALTATKMIKNDDRRASVITRALQALSETNQPSQAVPLFREMLGVKRRTGRLAVLQLLRGACSLIAKIDECATLWRMYEAWAEIDAELGSNEPSPA